MPTLRRILVPVDFSPSSEAALQYAVFLASHFGASIDVLHVWQTPDYTSPDMLVQLPGEALHTLASFAEKKARSAMDALVAGLVKPDAVRVTSQLESGDACGVVLAILEESFYDLLVMGTHGRTGLAHLIMGSVAEKVARGANCPVLTVRASPKRHEGEA